MENSEKPNRLLPPWIEASSITTLLIPLFYTAGWSYAYHYFERFNLGLVGLDIPKSYFFLFSYWAIKDQFWLFFLALTCYLAAYTMGKIAFYRLSNRFQGARSEQVVSLFPAVAVPVMIFSLFLIFYHFGERAAVNAFDWQAANDFTSYQRVQVWADAPGTPGFGEGMKKEWEKGCYRLFMKNKDHLILFYPGQPGDKMPTDIIPNRKIEMVRILTENRSCGGKTP